MNVFNFLVALTVCGALCFIVCWLTKFPINIKIITAKELPKLAPPPQLGEKKPEENVDEAELNKTTAASMDAVIGAVNKLMGVEEEEPDVR